MAYTGMNAAVVERIARDLQTCATRLTTAVNGVDSIVTRTQTYWVGADATKFASQWRTDRTTLTSLSSSISSLSRTASNQAAEQRRISAALAAAKNN